MTKNFSFNVKFGMYILGYHLIIILFLLFLLKNGDVNFDLIFNYKVLFNPYAYKSVFYYLYGYYGYLGIIAAHIISITYIIVALWYETTISKRILFIHGLLPLYGSVYGYLFYKKVFINFGFFGEILGYLLNFYFQSWTQIIFYIGGLALLLFSIQYKNIVKIIFWSYFILEKMRIIGLIKYMYKYFISWVFFFIPLLKKYYKSNNYINIEALINRSIYADFYKVSQNYGIKNVFDKQEANKELLPYQCITVKKDTIMNYNIEMNDVEKNLLLEAFMHFDIQLTYVNSMIGPLVNTIIVTPEKNAKLIKINQLLPDIARIIGKPDMRCIYPVADYPHSISFEYCHHTSKLLNFLEYADDTFFLHTSPLTLLLGVNTLGIPYYIDIAKAPHILLAGTTGSGKSNILNLCIVELIWKNSDKEVQLLLLDPKKSEFFLFQSLPHLLLPIAYSIDEIENAIIKATMIMEKRYNLFNQCQCKNIYEYNEKYEKLSYIVIVIDEYADIVIQSKMIELKIIRLLQMSRAAGIHIILATQRPSADIISSIVKSNLPMRIACKVISTINSRIILDVEGAEKLLGNSDMLISFNNKYDRVHGLFINTQTIEQVVNCFLKHA